MLMSARLCSLRSREESTGVDGEEKLRFSEEKLLRSLGEELAALVEGGGE